MLIGILLSRWVHHCTTQLWAHYTSLGLRCATLHLLYSFLSFAKSVMRFVLFCFHFSLRICFWRGAAFAIHFFVSRHSVTLQRRKCMSHVHLYSGIVGKYTQHALWFQQRICIPINMSEHKRTLKNAIFTSVGSVGSFCFFVSHFIKCAKVLWRYGWWLDGIWYICILVCTERCTQSQCMCLPYVYILYSIIVSLFPVVFT